MKADGALRCALCDTVLQTEVSDGRIFEFTKHTPEFCRTGTLHRIAVMQRAFADLHELYAHEIRRYIAATDQVFTARGEPTARERGQLAHAEAELRGQCAYLGELTLDSESLRRWQWQPVASGWCTIRGGEYDGCVGQLFFEDSTEKRGWYVRVFLGVQTVSDHWFPRSSLGAPPKAMR